MPEQVSGQSSEPSRSDAEQWFRDTLARLEAQQAALAKAVAELSTQLAEVAQAEAILRRAAAPGPPRRRNRSQRRRGDTFLRVVQVALVAVLGVGAVLALMAPRHLREQQYSPRCTAACARPAAHHTGRKASP